MKYHKILLIPKYYNILILLFLLAFLMEIIKEAKKRWYNFDESKIHFKGKFKDKIPVSDEQINYEFKHLLNKLQARDFDQFKNNQKVTHIETNWIFLIYKWEIEKWEKISLNWI